MNAQTLKQQVIALLDCNDSILHAIQCVRRMQDNSTNPVGAMNKIIVLLAPATSPFTDPLEALHVAQHLVEKVMKDQLPTAEDVAGGVERSLKIRKTMAWMFEKDGSSSAIRPSQDAGATTLTVESVNMTVVRKSNGKLKKGGKAALAEELFKKYKMGDNPVTNKEFVEILMKDAEFTRAGANTYTYNLRKKFNVA